MQIKQGLKLRKRYNILKIAIIIFILTDIAATTMIINTIKNPFPTVMFLVMRILYISSMTLLRQEHITGTYNFEFKELGKIYLVNIVEDIRDDKYIRVIFTDPTTNLQFYTIECIKSNVLSNTSSSSKTGYIKTELKKDRDNALPIELEGLLYLDWDRKSLHSKVTTIKGKLIQKGSIKTNVEMQRV